MTSAAFQPYKAYDLLVLPNANHRFGSTDTRERNYAVRRLWDYFVEHLMGVTPPQNFSLKQTEQAN